MNIAEYKLTITCDIAGINDNGEVTVNESVKVLVWRGRENVMICEKPDKDPLSDEKKILIPFHVLQKFMEMLE